MGMAVAILGSITSVGSVAGCSTSVSPADYVTAHAQDAHSVVVSVQSVQAATGIYDVAAADIAAAAALQQILSDAKGTFEHAKTTFASAKKPSGVGDAGDEMFGAVDELSTAISADKAFVDNQRPSDLADFGTHSKQGRVWWNEAVTKIWSAASQSAPTVNAS